MLQRHFSALLLAFYSLLCLAFLSWSADPFVRTLKHSVYYLTSPVSLSVLSQMAQWGAFGENMSRLLHLDQKFLELSEKWRLHRLREPQMQSLLRENERLKSLLDFQAPPTLRPLAGRVWLRDANEWFNSLLLRRGKSDGVTISDPVVTIESGRPVLLGRVIETFETTCRVLLVTDPVSGVSAELAPSGVQGAVEGLGRDELVMNYLLLDSEVRLGDEVVTAGLGGGIPEGILLGYVRAVETDVRESFKRAFLKPAVRLDRVREVFILRRPEGPARIPARAAPGRPR